MAALHSQMDAAAEKEAKKKASAKNQHVKMSNNKVSFLSKNFLDPKFRLYTNRASLDVRLNTLIH